MGVADGDYSYRRFVADLRLEERDSCWHLASVWLDTDAREGEREDKHVSKHPLRLRLGSGNEIWSLQRLDELRDRFLNRRTGVVGVEDEESETRTIGRELLDAALPAEGRDRWIAKFVEARRGGFGVRITLNLSEELEVLPWELLNVGSAPDLEAPNGFLALDPGFSIVRTGSEAEKRVPTGRDPLRILVVDAGGTTLVEGTRTYDRLPGHGGSVARMRLAPETCQRVLDGERVRYAPDVVGELRVGGPYNVFHFTGHGEQGGHVDCPRLLFPDDTAPPDDRRRVKARSVYPDLLGRDLSQAGVELAVIAACHAGTGGWWTGFGAKLLENGVPGVISMQALLEDRAGDIFCGALYECLRRGRSLDAAVAAARRRVYDEADFKDWWLPVVHARSEVRFAASILNEPGSAATVPSVLTSPMKYARQYFLEDGAGRAREWSLPGGGPSSDEVLSSDAAACARVDGNAVRVGLLDTRATVNTWWTPFDVPGLRAVVSLHAHPRHTELLVVADGVTRILVAYPDGYFAVRDEQQGVATAAGWVGDGFWWLDEHGCFRSDARSAPYQLPAKGLTGLDVALGREVWMVGVTTGDALVVERGSVDSRGSEVRARPVEEPPSRIAVVRSLAGEPESVVIALGERLQRWHWDDLTGP